MGGNLLQDFITEYFSRPRRFKFGRDDCTLGLISDWVKLRLGTDIGEKLRGIYQNKEKGWEYVEEQGGFIVLGDRLFEGTEVVRTNDPVTGDIGVVIYDGEPTMAIRVRHLWGIRAIHGFAAVKAECLAAWRIP